MRRSWTTLRMSRPLTVISRSRGGLSANEKEENFASNDNHKQRPQTAEGSSKKGWWLEVYVLFSPFVDSLVQNVSKDVEQQNEAGKRAQDRLILWSFSLIRCAQSSHALLFDLRIHMIVLGSNFEVANGAAVKSGSLCAGKKYTFFKRLRSMCIFSPYG